VEWQGGEVDALCRTTGECIDFRSTERRVGGLGLGAEKRDVAVVEHLVGIHRVLPATDEQVRRGIGTGSDGAVEGGVENDEIVIASLGGEDAAEVFQSGAGGEFGALAIDKRAGGIPIDADDEKQAHRQNEQRADDDQHCGKREAGLSVRESHGFQNESALRKLRDRNFSRPRREIRAGCHRCRRHSNPRVS